MLDLNYPAEYGTDIHEGYFKVISDQEIEGYADTRVAGDYILHYNIKFNKPFKTFNGWKLHQSWQRRKYAGSILV